MRAHPGRPGRHGPAGRPEVLAPAGSPAALAAALHSGADAVYFGLQEGFNARARAANFALAELPVVVAAIHRAGARAYVTLNTLVFEPELPHLEQVLRAIATAGVDALIVQDPAVCVLAQAVCPGLELHASTQMTVADAAAAEFAASLGVSRVVVPRELSVAEIRAFAAATRLELEVFVHGALCVSWSGQCLTSEAWGGRSANRGQCAQSCRMPYELIVDEEPRDLGDVRYLLSPKDLAGANAVPELIELGVAGLKIEGRQKSPDYVATATAGYRRWVDALLAGQDLRAARRQLAQDLLQMSLSYSRGFSAGFLAGSDHQTLVEGRFPKHRGVYLGRVEQVRGSRVAVRRARVGHADWSGALAVVQRPAGPQGEVAAPLQSAVAPAALEVREGMGVVFDQGRPEGDEPGGPVFSVDERDGLVWLGFGAPGPDLARVHAGDRVFVSSDGKAAARLGRATQGKEPAGRVRLVLTVAGAAGGPLTVRAATSGGPVACAAELQSEEPLSPASGQELDAGILRDKLGAFGGTPFTLAALEAAGLQPGLYLSPAALKALRRRLVAVLLPQLERGVPRQLAAAPVLPALLAARASGDADVAPAAPELVPLVRSEAQLEAAIAAGCREVELDWMEFAGLSRAVERARKAGVAAIVATPRIGKPGEERIEEHIRRLAPDGVLVRHLGALVRFSGALRRPVLHGDFSLNVANSLTARELLRRGLATVTAAFDLDEDQLFALLSAAPRGRVAVVVHHRIPTFHTEHCLYAHLLGNGRDFRSCGRPCERHRIAVRDHLGRDHPVLVDVGCRNTVFHHEPQQAARWASRLLAAGVQRFRVEFVREDGAAVGAVLGAWSDLLAGRATPDAVASSTGALAQIGVAQGRMALLSD